MRENKFCISFLLAMILSVGFSVTALANSSWVWITQSRPYDVLPFVIVFTLVAETYVIKNFCDIENTLRVFIPVFIGNIISYAMPYAVDAYLVSSERIYSLEHFWEYGHFYTVGMVFIFITLAVEIPTVYFFLRKKVEDKKNLLKVIGIINIITTVAVALIERVICRGRW